MVEICTCCGAVIPEPNPGLRLTELAVYEYIAKHPKCSINQIHYHLYQLRPDGGPHVTVISVFIHKLNKKLKGHKIRSTGGPGATYSLVQETEPTS